MIGDSDGLSWWQKMVNRPATNSTRNALLWGVAWLIIATIFGWYLRLMPVSIVEYDICGYIPLIGHLLLNVLVWLISASLICLFAMLYNRKVQIVEFYSRMLFAHWPITLLMLPRIWVDNIEYAIFVNDLSAAFDTSALSAILFAVFVAVIVVWYLYWSYRAFVKTSQSHAWYTFIIAIYY